MGINPDIIITRVDSPMPEDVKAKIAMFCNVEPVDNLGIYPLNINLCGVFIS